MFIVLITRMTPKGYVQHTTLNELDGSLRQFDTAQDAEMAGHDLLNTKGSKVTWYEIKRIY
jgi:hypothetical protein